MIGYYVHHHGRGHLQRVRAIAREVRSPLTVLSSLDPPDDWTGSWLRLPLETAAAAHHSGRDHTAHGTFHYLPVHDSGLRRRMAAIAGWLDEAQPSVFVADVSVEVAVLARSFGIPVVTIAMPGDRSDRVHRMAYDLSERILAPFPDYARGPAWPQQWEAKTVYVGAFSTDDGRPTDSAPPSSSDHRRVLVLAGQGGSDITPADVADARHASRAWRWEVAGLDVASWQDDPWSLICHADVVVTHAGQGAVAAVAAARKPAVIIPQHRPFGEQAAIGAQLSRHRHAVVLDRWPAADRWPEILRRAASQNPNDWSAWAPGDGARRAAVLLDGLTSG